MQTHYLEHSKQMHIGGKYFIYLFKKSLWDTARRKKLHEQPFTFKYMSEQSNMKLPVCSTGLSEM